MNSNKEHIIASLIVVMSFIIIGISGSYAYYVNSVNTIGDTGLSVTSGSLTMNFKTLNDKYINVPLSELIKDEDVFNSEQFTSFSVNLPLDVEVESAAYNLYLTDIKITSNYKSKYLKWALYDDSGNLIKDNSGNDVVGTFENVTFSDTFTNVDGYVMYDVEDIVLLSNKNINKGVTDSYRLYIWLSFDANNLQNELLNGSLEGKVGFKGYTK